MMRAISFKFKHKAWFIGLLGVFLAFLFAGTQSSSVSAKIYDDMNVVGKATAYEYVRILQQCYAEGNKQTKVSESGAGKLFVDRAAFLGNDIDTIRIFNAAIVSGAKDSGFWDDKTNLLLLGGMGPWTLKFGDAASDRLWSTIRGTNDAAPVYGCNGLDGDNTIWTSMFSFFGLEAKEFICWGGDRAYKPKNGTCTETKDSDYKLPFDNWSGIASDARGAADDWRDRTKDAMKDLVGIDWDNVSDGVRHQVWLNELLSSCGVSPVSKESYDATVDSRRYMYQSVDAEGEEVTVYLTSARDNFQYGGDGSKTCKNAETKMAEYSKAYIDDLKLDFANGIWEDPAGTSDDSDELTTSCAIEGVGWIVCPVISFIGSITDGMYSAVSGFLSVDTSLISVDSGTYRGWTVMRNFANAGLVIVFLLIIFSQLTSLGLSNYGIKKLLPRLVIAAILINVSFFVTQIAVDISNILGASLKDLFSTAALYPEGGATSFWAGGEREGGISEVVAMLLAGSGTVVGIAVGVGVLVGFGYFAGIGLLVMILLAAVLAVAITFMILAARMALVVVLIVAAPLAFLAMVLPNTKSWYEKWQKMFIAILIIFPMVAVLFGVSQMASEIIIQGAASDAGRGLSDQILTILLGVGVATIPLFATLPMLKGSLNAVPMVGKFAQQLSKYNPLRSQIQSGVKRTRADIGSATRGAAFSGRFGGAGKYLAGGRARRAQKSKDLAAGAALAEAEYFANNTKAPTDLRASAVGALDKIREEDISNIIKLDTYKNVPPKELLGRLSDSSASLTEKIAAVRAIEARGGMQSRMEMARLTGTSGLQGDDNDMQALRQEIVGSTAKMGDANIPYGGSSLVSMGNGTFDPTQAHVDHAKSKEFTAKSFLGLHTAAREEFLDALAKAGDQEALTALSNVQNQIKNDATLSASADRDLMDRISRTIAGVSDGQGTLMNEELHIDH